jgi:acetyl esterase/lipase
LPKCWRGAVFSNKELKRYRDIQYGSAFNELTKQEEPLLLDAYLPPDDGRTHRPVVVYIHGGGFKGGDKSNEWGHTMLRWLARKGYVGVSINYRLTKGAYEAPSQQHVLDAVEDARAAVRFLHANQERANLDTDRIGLFGTSAGAVTALAYGYVEMA